jgi:vancomycin permeability regulator SanA
MVRQSFATHHRAVQVATLVLGPLLVAAAAGLAGAVFWVNWTTHSFRYAGIDQVPARDVAIVPGVGAPTDRMPRILRERLAPALALYRAHKVRAILVSGVGDSPKRDEITTMVRWLRDRGVAPQHILSDPAGFRTLDTMRRASRLLNVHSAVICTQRVHIARALFLARAAGIDAVGLEAPSLLVAFAPTLRQEAAKNGLALIDTYLIDRQPKYVDVHGARIGQAPAGSQAAAFNL